MKEKYQHLHKLAQGESKALLLIIRGTNNLGTEPVYIGSIKSQDQTLKKDMNYDWPKKSED